ncbi:MAG: hypothetical protein ACD_67C00002G0002 [uncultured bacterium]|nr:MAG: hypothetical protein ACD_67C00002G0002 [uncultured bacterium]
MQFNLLDEFWIPVTRQDGTTEMIAPWQVTDRFVENPIVSLNAPRADFNGALIQFLIGLVQTVAAPRNTAEWEKKLMEPPTSEELKAVFSTVHGAFELGGNGPKFMQDFAELNVPFGTIDGLLIEIPGENAKKKNTDHFIKRNMICGVCPSCCAMALFTMQTNAPAGGAGFRVSLRGGGPLSTLIIGDEQHASLWQLVWLNILEQSSFLNICGNSALSNDAAKFPWLMPTRISEKDMGLETTPEDMHPSVMFWGMPRRIRLNLTELSHGNCDICGAFSEQLILKYQDKNYGMNFTGAWLHPLSPYGSKDSQALPVHAQPGGICYRHWLGLVQQDSVANRMPARIVHEFIERSRTSWQFRLWAFGYDMDNMKARCWYESTMPLLHVDATFRREFENYVAGMIKAASEVAGNTRSAIKKAWFHRPGDAKGDISFVDADFWMQTEQAFYDALKNLCMGIESGADTIATRQIWHQTLCVQAISSFDTYAWEGPIEDADPKRVVVARKELGMFNHGKKIKDLLELPVKQKSRSKAVKKKDK